MALYVGSNKIKINLDGSAYQLNLYSTNPILNGALLLSSDSFVLKDSSGLYVTAKEEADN